MHGSIKARICTTAVPYILAGKAPYFTQAKNTSDADNHHGSYIQDLGLYTIIDFLRISTVYKYYLKHERPREFVYPIQHGRAI